MAQSGKSLRVLVVDDYKANTIIAGAYLDRFGYLHDICSSGFEAIKKATSGLYDIVLMDIQMPTMDGIEATGHIRSFEKQHKRPAVPIIAMTSHYLVADRDLCLNAGMDDYILKPFDPVLLKDAIERLMLSGGAASNHQNEDYGAARVVSIG